MSQIKIQKVVPALPAVNLKETIAFYKNLGFTNIYENNIRSNGYAVMVNDYLEFHIYTYKKLEIPTPTNTYLYQVNNVDALHTMLATQYKEAVGKKLPRTGLPRMGVPKSLNFDRRFSLTDMNGNNFIFLEVFEQKNEHHIKTRFEKLYWESNTLAYSHESPIEAKKMLETAIKRQNLQNEQPSIIFQAYVLLVDCSFLLGNIEKAKIYYQEATNWLEKVTAPTDEYFADAIIQYEKYSSLQEINEVS
ncbi:hypothetical protein DOK78_002120 [Enterococcus sp. DIV2402]|uniref:VOC domain-containing protein n=1 Tax=Candidatus Enterococcus lowellii TaxID=2230877 RepID=A0ABZ2SPK7_9ENTE|nr:hypothetical protein [Enterococcus sp. DIV2402]MBO0463754.1 hypothetical protein [Enterococcus sp. DIV2402]